MLMFCETWDKEDQRNSLCIYGQPADKRLHPLQQIDYMTISYFLLGL